MLKCHNETKQMFNKQKKKMEAYSNEKEKNKNSSNKYKKKKSNEEQDQRGGEKKIACLILNRYCGYNHTNRLTQIHSSSFS